MAAKKIPIMRKMRLLEAVERLEILFGDPGGENERLACFHSEGRLNELAGSFYDWLNSA
ncbi:hypothetical protein G3A56_27105 (plasmid) [Rhizobium oryzihabitans]|uniref:Uncharacterized protein n=1 Tax=Rhizobium oryzihabitans TaxID=2267833 RepID=A0A7L5BRA0_9HYPH|nr:MULTISPECIES: hypothetical protein [Rhizobium/Agrobacterium group]QIB41457.1 hypothetical protein G3A56_27105 [Rhizobium oryzihabitans]